MPTIVKLWEIQPEGPRTVAPQKLDLESRLEDWIAADVGLVSDDLLLIGRQVSTDHGGVLDLLAIDIEGNLAVLELKRDLTPRDIVAQVLDYASWVQTLKPDEIEKIATTFLAPKTLRDAFREKFGTDLPEVINDQHRLFVIAARIDPTTERIVTYLSETHDVAINAATFSYFRIDDRELLGSFFLLDEQAVESRAQRSSKRAPRRTWEELEQVANENEVLDLYRKGLEGFRPLFESASTTRSNVSFRGRLEHGGSQKTILSIFPERSSSHQGLVLAFDRPGLLRYFQLDQDELDQIFDNAKETVAFPWDRAFFVDEERLGQLIAALEQHRAS